MIDRPVVIATAERDLYGDLTIPSVSHGVERAFRVLRCEHGRRRRHRRGPRIGHSVSAVVSRGGRPDLAADWLARVTAPTLLIVGGNDDPVLALNRDAQRLLTCELRLDIVPGASHLFEEPGALDTVARLAADWFVNHFHGPSGTNSSPRG